MPKESIRTIAAERKSFSAILCPDFIRRERALSLLIGEYTKEATQSVSYYDAKNVSVTHIRDSLLTLSLFSQGTIVVINHCEELPATTASGFELLCKERFDGGSLIFIGSSIKHAGLKKILTSQKVIVSLEALKGIELLKWIAREFKVQGVQQTSPEVIDFIDKVSGHSPDTAVKLIEHLITYCNSEHITIKEAKELFAFSPESSDFELIELIMSRAETKASLLLKRLLDDGKSPFLLISLLARNFSQYYFIKGGLSENRSLNDLRTSLGLTSWVFEKIFAASKKYTTTGVSRALVAILEADSLLKNRSLGGEEIMDRLIKKLMPQPL